MIKLDIQCICTLLWNFRLCDLSSYRISKCCVRLWVYTCNASVFQLLSKTKLLTSFRPKLHCKSFHTAYHSWIKYYWRIPKSGYKILFIIKNHIIKVNKVTLLKSINIYCIMQSNSENDYKQYTILQQKKSPTTCWRSVCPWK